MSINNKERRQLLIDEMDRLKSESLTCARCTGANCCTFELNSMKITPLEAIELKLFLESSDRWNADLFEELRQCVSHYRLDNLHQGYAKKNIAIRKTYTCPFLKKGSLGCTIDPASKPYGCLGFNAQKTNAVDNKNCNSNQEILQERADHWEQEEIQKNTELKEEFGLDWDKLPIPNALLSFL